MLQWHPQTQAMKWCFFPKAKGLEVGSMSYLPELFLEKHDLKVSCDLFPEFSSDSGWYLNDCWGMNDPYVGLDLMWMGSLLVFFLWGSWFDPANNLLMFWYFGDDIDTARPTKLAKTRISTWTWPTVHNFLHPRFSKKNRKTARCFPTSYTVNRVITPISL